MKIRSIICSLAILFFLNSCVVKSLSPFYTKETISFTEEFLGKWKDNENGKWEVNTFESEILKGYKGKVSKEDKQLISLYKNSYFVSFEKKGKEAFFIATPFKIKDQLFLDFIPVDYDSGGINSLTFSHIVYAHSLVKFDVSSNGSIKIKWFDEDRIEDLFKEGKIKIKHEKVGLLNDKYLLTASSKELQKFVEKYIVSNASKKWETSIKFTLTKV